jgi:hypothetical protein
MPNPWDVPPRPASYCSTNEELYTAVGEALSGWGYVEDIVADIFAIIVEGAPLNEYINSMTPAVRAYGSVVSFEARAEMVQAAADAFFHVNPNHAYPV